MDQLHYWVNDSIIAGYKQSKTRFSIEEIIIVPLHSTKFSEYAFAVAGLSVWNALP